MLTITDWISHATVWDWLTNVTAILAIAMMSLLIFGFRRFMSRPLSQPIDYIGTGIWMLAFFNILRLFFWDLLPDFLDIEWREYGITSSAVNWVFNVLTMIAAWFKLKGFWLIVEEKEPGEYSVLTAVFYPKKLKLWLKSEIKGDKNG